VGDAEAKTGAAAAAAAAAAVVLRGKDHELDHPDLDLAAAQKQRLVVLASDVAVAAVVDERRLAREQPPFAAMAANAAHAAQHEGYAREL